MKKKKKFPEAIFVEDRAYYPNITEINKLAHLYYMESIVKKKQFAIMQIIKIYLLVRYQPQDLSIKYIEEKLEQALQGNKVELHPSFIDKVNVPDKIQRYFKDFYFWK